MILRPSVIFGQDDGFFNRFASMARLGPVLPLVGADTRFQPVFVDDVAAAAVKGILGEASGTFELGGPDAGTLREFVDEMLDVIHRKRIVINLPFWVARLMAFGCDLTQSILMGLIENKVLTRDQLKNLKVDNVVAEGARTLADLGIRPVAMGAVLPDYLWKFRPNGQYDELTASASNLRGDI